MGHTSDRDTSLFVLGNENDDKETAGEGGDSLIKGVCGIILGASPNGDCVCKKGTGGEEQNGSGSSRFSRVA